MAKTGRTKDAGRKRQAKTVTKKKIAAAKPVAPDRLTPAAKKPLRMPVKVSTRKPIGDDRIRPRSLGDRVLDKGGL